MTILLEVFFLIFKINYILHVFLLVFVGSFLFLFHVLSANFLLDFFFPDC